MKFKPNLQFKLLVIVSLVIVLILLFFYYLSVDNQKKIFYDSFRDSAINLAYALDASIGSKNELNDAAKLQSSIYKMIWLSSNVTGISIGLPAETGLKIVASNDPDAIGKIATAEDMAVYQNETIFTEVMPEPGGADILRVVTPVHIGGERVGIYSIKLTMDSLEKVFAKAQREFLMITLISILVTIGILSFSIKVVVIDSIKQILSGLEKIGGGELDYRVKTKRHDEIGDLFSGLNLMAEKLKDRTEALNAERQGLAEKVTQKTKELQEKINDLEKINRLTVDRELKMIELKKELKEYREKLPKEQL